MRAPARRRRRAGRAGDRLDRVPEQVAVVEPVALAEAAHRLAELRLDEREEDDRPPPARPGGGEVDVLARDDARMATTSNSCSGNCASTAWTTRAAVSPVASETTCSSTGSPMPTSGSAQGRRARRPRPARRAGAASGWPDALVVRHHQHLVEEAVDRRAELGGGGDRPWKVALGNGGLDPGRGLAERVDQRRLGLLGRERGVERLRGAVGLGRRR